MAITFVQTEITVGMILLGVFSLMIPFYVLTVHFRHFGPLRDVQPILNIFIHLGYFLMQVHLFFAWRHEKELCYVLAVLQLVSYTLLCGCFTCKHYALHKRYRVVTTQVPTFIVFVLAAFPFLLLSTYRVATREDDHCPNVDGVAGGCGLVIWLIVTVFLMLREHPSSHFLRAKRVEIVCLFTTLILSLTHQWVTDSDPFVIVALFSFALLGHLNFLAYTFPPIRLRLQRGNEFTDEIQRIQNDSVYYNGQTSYLGVQEPSHGDEEIGCADRVAECIGALLSAASPEERAPFANNDSIANGSSNGSDGGQQQRNAATLRGGHPHPSPHHQNLNGDSAHSLHSIIGVNIAQQRQLETTQELSDLIQIIKQGDMYRLQRVLSRRGIALINATDQNGRTPLHHAVRAGDVPIVQFLLGMGADANRFDAKGRAPLHEAVRIKSSVDRSSLITELVQGGAMVNLPASSGQTALHFAVQGGFLGVLNTLLRYDANPLCNHEKEDPSLSWQEAHVLQSAVCPCRKSPLTVAVEMGLDKQVSSMLHSLKQSKTRLNFDIRCAHGMTLLHVALCLGNNAVAHVLMTEGSCSPWSVNQETNMNCFHMLCLGDNPMCVSSVLAYIGAPDLLPDQSEYVDREAAPTVLSSGKKKLLGSGAEHALLTLPSSTSLPSVSDRKMSTNSKKVQYGCWVPSYGGTSPATMGFGEAMGVIREHIPSESSDPSRLSELEAAVDRVVAHLKTKSQLHDIDRLHCALQVVAKRIKLNSTRSLEHLYSAQSVGGNARNSSKVDGTNVLNKIEEYLQRQDNSGNTPLDYAIESRNAHLLYIFSAYGGVTVAKGGGRGSPEMTPLESPSAASPAPSSPTSSDGGGFVSNATLCGGNPLGFIDQHRDRATAAAADSETSLEYYKKRIRRIVEEGAELQDTLIKAIMDGLTARSQFLGESGEDA